jgi:DNA-binding LacI/PurR family transcriptional regulator
MYRSSTVATRPRTDGTSRRPTVRDVAKLAGVSIQTVSNVARGHYELMTPETRARVEGAMEAVGYHPNVSARSLRAAKSQTLGFLVLDEAPSFLADPLTALMVAGVGDISRDADYAVLIQSERPLADRRMLLRPLLEGRVDGAVLLMSGDPGLRRGYIDDLRRLGAAFVVFDEIVDDPAILSVRTNERKSAQALTEHLLASGHVRVAFIAARLPWPVIEQRYLGYRDALAGAGVEPVEARELFEATWQAEGGRAMASELLSLREPPTAIICGSDVLAIGAIRAVKEHGMRVPHDVAVTGFDDFEFSAYVDPPLTTVRVPGYEMGRRAATMLIDALAGRPVSTPDLVLENELVIRRSG